MPEVEYNKVEIHEPRIIVRPECAEHCNALRRVVSEAALQAVMDPNGVHAVVCAAMGRFGCNAAVYQEASLVEMDEGQYAYLRNPARMKNWSHVESTVAEEVAEALERGATEVPLSEMSRY
jgi:hypothetical protein